MEPKKKLVIHLKLVRWNGVGEGPCSIPPSCQSPTKKIIVVEHWERESNETYVAVCPLRGMRFLVRRQYSWISDIEERINKGLNSQTQSAGGMIIIIIPQSRKIHLCEALWSDGSPSATVLRGCDWPQGGRRSETGGGGGFQAGRFLMTPEVEGRIRLLARNLGDYPSPSLPVGPSVDR